jgi:hypothetical protein
MPVNYVAGKAPKAVVTTVKTKSLTSVTGLRDPNEKVSPSPHMRTETDPVSETLCFLIIQNSGRWTKSRNTIILSPP